MRAPPPRGPLDCPERPSDRSLRRSARPMNTCPCTHRLAVGGALGAIARRDGRKGLHVICTSWGLAGEHGPLPDFLQFFNAIVSRPQVRVIKCFVAVCSRHVQRAFILKLNKSEGTLQTWKLGIPEGHHRRLPKKTLKIPLSPSIERRRRREIREKRILCPTGRYRDFGGTEGTRSRNSCADEFQ